MADRIYRTAEPLLRRTIDAAPFRLIGIGLGTLVPAIDCDPEDDLLDRSATRRLAAERAADAVRARFGSNSIIVGRSLD